MQGGRHGRVIQGYFAGAPRIPAPPAGAGPHAAHPPRPGPPAPCCGPGHAPVQAKPIAGRPFPPGHRPHPVVQAHGADQRFEVDPVRIGLARTAGTALPTVLLAKMEAAFGADFSAVRVHVGPQPARIGALAFTTGDQLYFAPGQYQPDTPQGQRLIGHELAHVIQQRQGRVPAQGTGVTVIQNKLLEAEADRLGARAAAWSATRQPGLVRPVLPAASRTAPARAVQRMPEPKFKIDGNAKHIFAQGAQDVDQGGLNSVAQTGAGSGLIPLDSFNARNYVMSEATAGVFARLKVNGALLVIGSNQHTHPGEIFTAGIQMRSKIKDNFHAEDWVIKGFKDEFANARKKPGQAGLTLDAWLDTLGVGKNGNPGNVGKHFLSLAISACPCLGCTVSLRAFKAYLDTALGHQAFVFRVKFLRTYELPITAYSRQSDLAKSFVSTIGGLRKVGIHVRMQPTRSARKLYGRDFVGETIRMFATNHDAVQEILTTQQGAFLRQSWSEMGVGRKGTVTQGEAGVRFSLAPSREHMPSDFGDMTDSWVIPGSQAANRPRKERKERAQPTVHRKRKKKEAPQEQPMRRQTLRHGPYPGAGTSYQSTPGAQDGTSTTTTTTTTTTTPSMHATPVYQGPPQHLVHHAPPTPYGAPYQGAPTAHYGTPYLGGQNMYQGAPHLGGPPQPLNTPGFRYPVFPTLNLGPPQQPRGGGSQPGFPPSFPPSGGSTGM